MDVTGNADSDNSMTWEDFFGSTTDLTPTLLGIFDSILIPTDQGTPKKIVPNPSTLYDIKMLNYNEVACDETVDYTNSERNGYKNNNPHDENDNINSSKTEEEKIELYENDSCLKRILSNTQSVKTSTITNLSPNVKRMITASQRDVNEPTKQIKNPSLKNKTSFIPLAGTTSKLSQAAEYVTHVDTVDLNVIKQKIPDKKQVDNIIYDTPRCIKTTDANIEELSLPYIDQSQELTNREAESRDEMDEVSSSRSQISKNGIEDRRLSALKGVDDTGSSRSDQVKRPLSLSSIASSSSTSSGGPTRAGANSAYLASIESLDDHSDGEEIPVDSAVNQVAIISPSQLELVCDEIINTENIYVEDLRQVVVSYLRAWREDGSFADDELDRLFANIEEIYIFNKKLCTDLNDCGLDALSIAKCFARHQQGFEVYTAYCTSYPSIMDTLTDLVGCTKAVRFRETQLNLGHPLPLNSYLLKPVQRILKYHLLLKNLVKHCRCPETEYALNEMTSIAENINEMKKKHEHAVRVQEIQSLLYGWTGADFTTYGELCAEGTFRVYGAKAKRHVFLFDKMVLVTKNKEDGMLAYKTHIMCHNLMLFETLEGAPLCFQLIPYDNPRGQVTLMATSVKNKRDWTLLIKRAMLESLQAAIPERAVQLVMQLGQNKTDDDILAEKSTQRNNIITSSIRKAPIYLENRKSERERRKQSERNKKRSQKSKEIAEETCDCSLSTEDTGVDVTCEKCHVEVCNRCELQMSSKSDQLTEKYQKFDSFENLHSSQESISKGNYQRTKSVDELNNANFNMKRITENVASGNSGNRLSRTRYNKNPKFDKHRSRSKDDPQKSKFEKIRNWRRVSEPGFKQNETLNELLVKHKSTKNIFYCKVCGSNKIMPPSKFNNRFETNDTISPSEKYIKKANKQRRSLKPQTKFYTDLYLDVPTDVLHIKESNESLNVEDNDAKQNEIDDVTYRKLIEKTDSFKKSELEKSKCRNGIIGTVGIFEEDVKSLKMEEPIECIISNIVLENKDFQKLLQKQQRSALRRQNRLMKTHSYPEEVLASSSEYRPLFTKMISENAENYVRDICIEKTTDDDHIYETLIVDKADEKVKKKSDSDYVYLTFDELNRSDEVIYDVPSPTKSFKSNHEDNEHDDPSCVSLRSKENVNPACPEVWVSRQQEHFNTTSDRKSGSLPRSFQVTSVGSELKSPKSILTKSYLNKDGKVVHSDRPFTIASDKGDMSYDDMELLKNDHSFQDSNNVSKSTLELEDEINSQFRSKFGDAIGDTNITTLSVSQQDIDTSFNSSCEALTFDKSLETKMVVHPEHKIYKSFKNRISITNVINKLKTKSSRKNSTETEADVEQPEYFDRKSLANRKMYTKNFLQKFKSKTVDDNIEKNTTKTTLPQENAEGEAENSALNTIEEPKISKEKPKYDQSIHLNCSTNTKSKGKDLLVYQQGSEDLGARIAQPEYADPQTLVGKDSKNVLINKPSLRPDSLFSSSAFITTSASSGLNCNERVARPDQSYYEKSFESIENFIDDDSVRDSVLESAVYSDQDEQKTSDKDQKINPMLPLKLSKSSKSEALYDVPLVSIKVKAFTKTAIPKLEKPILPKKPHVFVHEIKITDKSDTANIQTITDKESKPIKNDNTKNNHLNIKSKNIHTIDIQNDKSKPKVRPKSFAANVLLASPNYKSNIVKRDIDINGELSKKSETETDEYESLSIKEKKLAFERQNLNRNRRSVRTNEIQTVVSKSVYQRKKELENLTKENESKPIVTSENDSETVVTDMRNSWVQQVVNKFQ